MRALFESLYKDVSFDGEPHAQQTAMSFCIGICAQAKKLLSLNTGIGNKLAIIESLTESISMQEQDLLIESMHPLVTPEFTGTHEEMISAINFWVALVSQLRSLPGTITAYENREAIIKQVELEVASLRSELQNVSSVATIDDDGAQSMTQPKTDANDQAIEPDNAVDLSVTEDQRAADLRRLAGISSKTNTLATALRGYAK
jgi:hypothetical protein